MTDREVKINITAKGADVAAKGLQKVSTAIKGTATTAGGLTSVMSSLKNAVGPMLAAFGAFKGAQALTGFLSSSVKEYESMRMATRGATEAQIAWATALEKSTGADADQALGLMRQAKQLGINESQLQDITAASVGLAEVLQVDVESAFGRVMQAVEGNASALNRMIPGLKELDSEEAKLAKISEVAAEGLKQRKENLSSLSGVTEQAAHSWGNFQEAVGEILAPMVTLATHGFGVAAETLSMVLVPAMDAFGVSATNIKPIMEGMKTAIVGAITGAEVAIKNLPTIWDIAITTMQLSWVEFVEDFKHGFSVQLPQLVEWFQNNWKNMFTDMFVSTMTIAENWFKNFGDIIKTGWDFIAGGMEGGMGKLATDLSAIANRNLLDGFKATTEALPDLIERSLSDEEQSLKSKLQKLGGGLSDEFNKKFSERMKALQTPEPGAIGLDSLGPSGSGGNKKIGELQALESRLLVGGRGGSDIQEKIEKNTQELANAAKEQRTLLAESKALLKQIADKSTVSLEVVT